MITALPLCLLYRISLCAGSTLVCRFVLLLCCCYSAIIVLRALPHGIDVFHRKETRATRPHSVRPRIRSTARKIQYRLHIYQTTITYQLSEAQSVLVATKRSDSVPPLSDVGSSRPTLTLWYPMITSAIVS